MFRILKITAQNFMGYSQLEVEQGPGFNGFYGPSDEGKTTEIITVETCLHGRNEHADGGQGLDYLTRLGAKRSTLALTMQDTDTGEVFQVERSIPAASGVTEMQAGINQRFARGYSPDAAPAVFRFCLRPGGPLNMKPADFKSIIFEIFGAQFTDATITAGLKEFGGPVPIGEYYEQHRLSIQASGDDLKWVSERLTDLNRENKRVQAQIDGYKTANPPPFDRVKYDAKVTELASVNAELANIELATKAATGAYEERLKAHEREKRAWEALRVKSQAARTRQATLAEQVAKDNASHAAAEALLKKSTSEQKLRASIAETTQVQAEAMAQRDAVIAQMNGREACISLGQCARALAATWAATLRECNETAASTRKRLETLHEAIRQRDEAAKTMAMLKGSIDRVTAELATIDTSLPPAPEWTEGVSPGQSEVQQKLVKRQGALTLDIEQMGGLRRGWEQAEANRKTAAALEEGLAEAKTEAALLDVLKKALGPAGVRARLVEGKLREFERQVSDICEEWGAPRVHWDTRAPDWMLMAILPAGEIPARQTAKSVRLRISGALQVAMARAAGFGIVCIDEMEAMDVLVRSQVRDYLIDAEDIQSLVVTVSQTLKPWDPDSGEEPELQKPVIAAEPRMKAFWVCGGEVSEIAPMVTA